MSRRGFTLIGLSMALCLLVGCGRTSGRMTIAGSTSAMFPIGILAETYEKRGGDSFGITPVGSTAGILALERGMAALGMIVSYGMLHGLPEQDVFKAMRANIERSPAVRCFTMHSYDHMPEPRREAMRRAIDLLAGGVRPAIAARLPLDEAARAHALLEARGAIGKVVLKP